jgi:glucans biosynthesis protein
MIVFQGATYFRALSRNQAYGASARGLALNVAQPGGEEFPLFRTFWIEKPEAGASAIVIHALLDSPSVTGAYRFVVTPGAPTGIDVSVTLYPRRELVNVGLAPLTSMFLFSGLNRARVNDFRTGVHDSDALAIRNGWDERLWRPLNNPRRLQSSSFLDKGPKGFGLIQRARRFSDFQDLEASYERRPSLWVEPNESWGAGAVELIEIPTEEEIHDNIVAYWKPARPMPAGKPFDFSYKLGWPDDVPPSWAGATVHASRSGFVIGPLRKSGAVQFAVEFVGKAVGSLDAELPIAAIDANGGGVVGPPVVQTNPATGGVRVSFIFDPKGAASSELRLVLQRKGQPISETWLYRWTKD